jgi:RNA 2',3'-cyclic 3'-phosphodiesterase
MADDGAVRTDDPALRLFLAVDVPETAVLAVSSAIEPWRAAFPRVRWVPPENRHITLKFLGATEADRVPWVEETVGGIVSIFRRVTVDVRGLGAFPSMERARVLWAGVDDAEAGLDALVTDLETGLAPVFRKEMRRFHPHVTVARSEPPVRLPAAYGDTPLVTGPFSIEQVVLYRSRLEGGSTTYEPLRSFPLTG